MSKKNFLILLIIGLIFLFSGFNQNAQAGSEHNVSGWAWSENIGWISFNNTSGGGSVNYGVSVDSLTGIFSGYAWSENIGWISFNESDLSGCPSAPCRAWLDFSDSKVHGWAKALTDGGGWPGWIRLRDTSYGVWLDTAVSPRELRGWAWSDMVVGWISSNCKNQGVCGTSNYKVILNLPPVVTSTSETLNPCAYGTTPQAAPGLSVILKWTYFDPDGTPQAAYEIWLDNDSNFTGAKFNYLVDPSPSNAYTLNLQNDQEGDWLSALSWNTTYYWKVRVKDSFGFWSNWSAVDSFTTPRHAYPYVNFNWNPKSPSANEIVQFTDQSEVYGGTTKASLFWTFQDGVPATSASSTPQIKFTSAGLKEAALTVTDSDGFFCLGSKTVKVSFPLPEWREVIPK